LISDHFYRDYSHVHLPRFPTCPLPSPGHPYHSKLARLDESWRKFANLPTLPVSSLLFGSARYLALARAGTQSPHRIHGHAPAEHRPQRLPTDIDPAQLIDPQLVLDFDMWSLQAEQEIDDLVIDMWIGNPVVIFSKVRGRPTLISHASL